MNTLRNPAKPFFTPKTSHWSQRPSSFPARKACVRFGDSHTTTRTFPQFALLLRGVSGMSDQVPTMDLGARLQTSLQLEEAGTGLALADPAPSPLTAADPRCCSAFSGPCCCFFDCSGTSRTVDLPPDATAPASLSRDPRLRAAASSPMGLLRESNPPLHATGFFCLICQEFHQFHHLFRHLFRHLRELP